MIVFSEQTKDLSFVETIKEVFVEVTDLAEDSTILGVVEVAALVLLQRLHDDLIVVAVSSRGLGSHVHVL